MNLCIPINEDRGIRSSVCPRLGSAPLFLIVDTESGTYQTIRNEGTHQPARTCLPLASFHGEDIDGVAVTKPRGRAVQDLLAGGTPVFLAESSTVEETIAALKAGALPRVTLDAVGIPVRPDGRRRAK